MMPSTEQEDRLLGPARDKTISQIKERGSEVYQQVRERAENAVEKVQQAVQNTMAEAGNAMKDREESNPQRGATT
jgi:DNA-binding PadR family transcriptional regulator